MNLSECPQNISIPSLASKCFKVEIQPQQSFTNDDDVMLFIDAILSDLMDAVGETFRVSVVRKTTRLIMSITIPKQMWLIDMAMRISAFQAGLNIFHASVDIDHGCGVWSREEDATYPKVVYKLTAKDGIYVEKVREKVIRTMKEAPVAHGFSLMFGGGQDAKYPSYETEYTRF